MKLKILISIVFCINLLMIPIYGQTTTFQCGYRTGLYITNVATVRNIVIPCGSTLEHEVYVLIAEEDHKGNITPIGFGGPQSVVLPTGWQFVRWRYVGRETASAVIYLKYGITIKAASPTTPGGTGSVKNSHQCLGSGTNTTNLSKWFYSPAKSFTITKGAIPARTSTITAPANVCPTTSRFTLNNVPAWATSVTWRTSSNLTPSSGTGTYADVATTWGATGNATVEFVLSGNGCSDVIPSTVPVGQPSSSITGSYIEPDGSGSAVWDLYASTNCGRAPIAYEWYLSWDGVNYVFQKYGSTYQRYLYCEESYTVKLIARTADGITSTALYSIYAYGCQPPPCTEEPCPQRVAFDNSLNRQKQELKDDVLLKNAYPNPFSRSTRIVFYVPATENIVLDLLDAKGRSVRTLAKGVFQPGYYGQEVARASLREGLYFYRLQIGNQVITKKLVLLP